MRLLPLTLATLAMACLVSCADDDDDEDTPAPAPHFTVKVIGFNDYHGNLQSPGTFGLNTSVPAASRPAISGADFLAAYLGGFKASKSPYDRTQPLLNIPRITRVD